MCDAEQQILCHVAVSRYLDNGTGSEPVSRQHAYNQTIMDQLMAAINECKQQGLFSALQL